MDIKTFQRFEPKVKRGVSKSCQICSKEFKLLNMDEHQCKRCLRAICQACGKTKRDVYKVGFVKTSHRLCSLCTKESDFIIQYIGSHQLKFGEDSPMVKKWLRKIPEQQQQQEVTRAKSHKNATKFTQEIFNQIWDSYNYSLREFIGIMTFTIDQKEVYRKVNRVYEQLNSSAQGEKLEQLIPLAIFLLCFSNNSSCLKLLTYLISLRQTVTDSKKLLLGYLQPLGMSQSDFKKNNEYFTYFIRNFTGCFSINLLTTQCSLHIVCRILDKGRIEELYIMLAMVLADNVGSLSKGKTRNDCDFMILRNCAFEKYVENYRLISNVKIVDNQQVNLAQNQGISKITISRKNLDQALLQKQKLSSTTQPDALSQKTKSFNSDDEPEQVASRKTQKNFKTNEALLLQKELSFNSKHEYCEECDVKRRKIIELQNVIKAKDKQIQNLGFRANLWSKEQSDNQAGSKNYEGKNRQGSLSGIESQEINKLQRQLLKKSEQHSNLFSELTKIQSQKIALTSQMAQLQLNNKMLKNRLESFSILPSAAKKNAANKADQQTKITQMLKQALENKIKELQQVMKKNKMLEYQLKQMQKTQDREKPPVVLIRNQEYMRKIEELTQIITQEQNQKIMVSEELFNLQQLIKQNHLQSKIVQKGSKNSSECTIF